MTNQKTTKEKMQKILVFQQNNSGESKVKGIRGRENGYLHLEIFSIDEALPVVIDDSSEYLPEHIQADIVVDYLKHPDLSYDLAMLCEKNNIPVVGSGKKYSGRNLFTPPT